MSLPYTLIAFNTHGSRFALSQPNTIKQAALIGKCLLEDPNSLLVGLELYKEARLVRIWGPGSNFK